MISSIRSQDGELLQINADSNRVNLCLSMILNPNDEDFCAAIET
jgi:hypothetical protein